MRNLNNWSFEIFILMSELDKANNQSQFPAAPSPYEGIREFKEVRGVLVKIAMQLITLATVILAYLEYLDSNNDYQDFVQSLNFPVIVDIKMIDSSLNCSTLNNGNKTYNAVLSANFPEIRAGCQCDGEVYQKQNCNFIKDNFLFKNKTTAQKEKLNITLKNSCSNFKARLLQEEATDPNTDPNADPTTNPGTDQSTIPTTNPGTDTTGTGTNSGTDSNTNTDPSINTDEPSFNPDDPNFNYNTIAEEYDVPYEVPDGFKFDPYDENAVPGDLYDEDGNLINQSDYYYDPLSSDFDFPDMDYDEVINDETTPATTTSKKTVPIIGLKVENGVVITTNSQGKPLDKITPEKLPTNCTCYQDIEARKAAALEIWPNNYRICNRFSKTTLKEYLSSYTQFRTCKKENKCQKYFCKKDGDECPIIEFWINTNTTTSTLVTDTENLKDKAYGKDFYNQVILPMTSIGISLKGKCFNNEKDNPGFSYGLIDEPPCATSQIVDPIETTTLEELMKANHNLYEKYSNELPFFKELLGNVKDLNYVLESKSPFYRKTLYCLMKNDVSNLFQDANLNSKLEDSNNKYVANLDTILYNFIYMETHFNAQMNIQTFQVIINCVLLFFLLIISIIKCTQIGIQTAEKQNRQVCQCCEEKICPANAVFKNFSCSEFFVLILTLICFLIDMATGILGGYTYFTIKPVADKIKKMMDLGCVENFTGGKFAAYGNSLSGTYNLNLQVFLIICFKFFQYIVTFIVYIVKLGCTKLCSSKSCFVMFYESIGEEEFPEDEEDAVNPESGYPITKPTEVKDTEKGNLQNKDEAINDARQI